MSDGRLVTVPNNTRLLCIPQEYLAICGRKKQGKVSRGKNKGQSFEYWEPDECAAAILYIIERWVAWKIRTTKGTISSQNVWVYFSSSQIEEFELADAFGSARIKAGFELLVELGFVSRRHNPNKKVDRTYQYRFEREKVQAALDNLPAFFTIEEWKVQKCKMHSSVSENALFNIEETIPHDPTHDPTQKTTGEPPAASPLAQKGGEEKGGQSPSQSDGEPLTPPVRVIERPALTTVYEQNIGPLAPMIVDQLNDIEKDYPPGWFEDAVKVAVLRGKRRLDYVIGILENWRTNGKDDCADQKKVGRVAGPQYATLTEQEKEAARIRQLGITPPVQEADHDRP